MTTDRAAGPSVLWEAPGRFSPKREFRLIIAQKYGTILLSLGTIPLWLSFFLTASDPLVWSSPEILLMFIAIGTSVFLFGYYSYRTDSRFAYPVVLDAGIQLLNPRFLSVSSILEIPWDEMGNLKVVLTPVASPLAERIGPAQDLTIEFTGPSGSRIVRSYSGINAIFGVDHAALATSLQRVGLN